MDVRDKNFLKNYIEVKSNELVGKISSIMEMQKTRDEYIKTKEDIVNKIFELRNSNKSNYQHIESLEDALLVYERDIDRLTLDISSEEKLVEEIRFDIFETEKELNDLID